ncbi:hypothetical protein [Butyrivibrio sp. WCE2006]|uniref:hypothetical protein n=1 Tax=Butyrivibrio sp. WCE2006 TaxID=1410611 RepID=UPI001A9A4ABF
MKTVYEKIPYIVKKPFSRMLRYSLIGNRQFVDTYNWLMNVKGWNQERIKIEQFKLCKEVVIHAYEHTKYYKELFDSVCFDPYKISSIEDISSVPVLTKQILNERFEDLIADDIKDGYLVTTGGTSGEPTKVMMANNAYYIEWAFVYNFWKEFGYRTDTSKLATFRGINLGKKLYEINPIYREIRMNLFSMRRSNIEKYVQAIKEYGAEFIYGYPSAIYNFCKLSQDAGIRVEKLFSAAFLISENLYTFQEETITKVLCCPIGMFYGHSERAVFGEKIEEGYVFNPMYGVTELGEDGDIIATGFINKMMPLIRYKVDDKAKEIHGKYTIEGHHNCDLLHGRNGEEISAAAINFHDKTFDKISGYQFVQEKDGECLLLINPKERMNSDEVNKVLQSVRKKLGDSIMCEVQVVDRINLSDRGKYKLIIRKK